MLKRTLTAIDNFSVLLGKFFSFIVLPVTLLEAAEVVLRYVLNSPTDWSWELAAMLSGAMFITGAAWVLKDGNHVRTDLIYANLSRKTRAAFDVFFFTVIFFSFAGVLTVKSIQQAVYSTGILEKTFSMWAPPLYPLKIIIALSFVALLLQGIAKWIRDIYFLVKGCEI